MARNDDIYGLLQSGLSPEIAAQARGIQQQQAIADALTQNGLTPMGGARSAGRYMVAPSWTEGLAKLAQVGVGQYMSNKGNQQYQDLAAKNEVTNRTRIADEMAKIQGLQMGSPAQSLAPATPNDDEGNMNSSVNMPAVAANPNAAIAAALAAQTPQARAYAPIIQAQYQHATDAAARAQQSKDDIAARAVEAKALAAQNAAARADEGALARADREAREKAARGENAANRADMIRLAASLKPALTGNIEKPMTMAQTQKFEKTLGDDFKSTGQVMQTMANLESSIADVSGSKGLGAREGYTGYLPAWAQGTNAMTAQNRIDTLRGKVTQMGKAMASMSGAIGPMAVQEWKIVSDAVNALDPKAGNFKEQLDNVQAQAQGASGRIKDWYERRYTDHFEKYPQFKTDAIPLYSAKPATQNTGVQPIKPAGAPAAAAPAAPAGVDPKVWGAMTPEERKLFQ